MTMSDENTPKRTRASHIFFVFLQELDLRIQFLEQSTLAIICIKSKTKFIYV